MKSKLGLLLLASLVIPSLAQCEKKATLNSLADLKWKHRILLIDQQGDGTSTLKYLTDSKDNINERHVVWIILGKRHISTNYSGKVSDKLARNLRETYFSDDHLAVLIGKDGTVKARHGKLDLDKVFALIDSMPMRKREMKEQKQ